MTPRGCLNSPADAVVADAAMSGVDEDITARPVADVAKANPWFNVREDKVCVVCVVGCVSTVWYVWL